VPPNVAPAFGVTATTQRCTSCSGVEDCTWMFGLNVETPPPRIFLPAGQLSEKRVAPSVGWTNWVTSTISSPRDSRHAGVAHRALTSNGARRAYRPLQAGRPNRTAQPGLLAALEVTQGEVVRLRGPDRIRRDLAGRDAVFGQPHRRVASPAERDESARVAVTLA
jgi:hypothetical protein